MGILVVDNDLATLRPLLELLRSSGYSAAGALDFDSAVTFIRRVPFDLLIAAVRAGEDSSLDLVRMAVEQQPEMAVIVHTAAPDAVVEQECEGLGVTYLCGSGHAPAWMKIVADTMGDLYRRRRWERKHILGGFTVRIGYVEARMVDMSYGGFRLETVAPPEVELPSSIEICLPSFGLSVTARLLWSRNAHPEGTGPWITGAALSETDESTARAWRMVVDALPNSNRPN